jgi:DNA-binding IclR family transcriptional regulator
MTAEDLESASKQKRRIQSIEVGFRVVRALQAAQEPMALREIAKATEMPPSKVHLYLASFLREGLVSQDPETGFYGLGDFAVELGLSAIRQLSVVERAKSEMDTLTTRTGCTTYLSLFTERGATIVAKVDGRLQGAFSLKLGHTLPINTSATGLSFLAFMPKSRTRPLVNALNLRNAEVTGALGERQPLQERIAEIRKLGYTATIGIMNGSFAAVASPIYDYTDEPAAVLTLLGPSKYLTGARMERAIADVVEATGVVSRKLGGKAGGPSRVD